ncbi:MAG: response regulator [candidate division KSB1 bacterium]|nr:response regulator [candidate division KSB1 bacterium]
MSGVGPRSLLVVDDEDDFLELVREIFGASGYCVKTARTAAEAEAILEGPPCEVAIIDYRLPGKNGTHVAHRVQQKWPTARIVFLTGDSEAAGKIKAEGQAVTACLVKPVEVDRLLALVDQLLSSP